MSIPQRPRRRLPVVPLVISALIALSMIFLLHFTNQKFEELVQSSNEALLIDHDSTDPIHQELAEKIQEFRPEACKMIEVYSMDFEQLFKVQFKEDQHHEEDIRTYTELIELLKSQPEGQTTIMLTDDTEEDIYFQWINASNNEPYLVIIYMIRPIVTDLWVFSFVCFGVIIMVFVLIFYFISSQNAERIKEYKRVSTNIHDALIR